jgi:hypothetical protein
MEAITPKISDVPPMNMLKDYAYAPPLTTELDALKY